MIKIIPTVIVGFLIVGGLGALALPSSYEKIKIDRWDKIEGAISINNPKSYHNNEWFYYSPYSNYAPSGVPDFDQKQNNWKDPIYNGWTFCGAVSVANILWYMDSSYSNPNGFPGDNEDLFPLVLDYNAQEIPNPGPNMDDHNFNNVNDLTSVWSHEEEIFGNELIERIAWYVDTNGCRTGRDIWGTPLNSMYLGVSKWLEDVDLSKYFELKIKYPKSINSHSFMPDENRISSYFIDNTHGNLIHSYDLLSTNSVILSSDDLNFPSLASQIINGSYVVLGINSYDEDKNVYLSHWVSVAGVNIPNSQIALSDPYFDKVNPTNDATLHNDASIVSHDIFRVNTTSPFPEEKEYFWLEDYIPGLYSVVPAVLIITPLADNIPQITPISYFIRPDTNYFFINDKYVIQTLFGNTIVVGDITFEANAYSKEGIEKIEFYVDDEMISVDDVFPYEWLWSGPSIGRFKIGIKAVDNVGNVAENEMTVWRFDL